MKHPCFFSVTSKEQSSTVCFHCTWEVRRELTQQEHTVTMPRWPAPGTTSIEPEPPVQPDPTLQSRAHLAGAARSASCTQGRGHEPRMLLHPGWLASSSLLQVPRPPGAWGHSCSKATFALCQVYHRAQHAAGAWSASPRGCCAANLAQADCGKNTPSTSPEK